MEGKKDGGKHASEKQARIPQKPCLVNIGKKKKVILKERA